MQILKTRNNTQIFWFLTIPSQLTIILFEQKLAHGQLEACFADLAIIKLQSCYTKLRVAFGQNCIGGGGNVFLQLFGDGDAFKQLSMHYFSQSQSYFCAPFKNTKIRIKNDDP